MQAGQARWIDSICYHAMLGEVLYQQGRNAEALASFDQACLLLLVVSRLHAAGDVRGSAAGRESAARHGVPWGQSGRQFAIGDFPRTMQIAMGSISGRSRRSQQGGTFLQAQYWRMNVAEVIRTSALAMRRRNELLGPLGKHDRISKELATTMSRRNLTLPNHWSQAWTELLAGIAKAGIGDAAEAKARLDRAVIVGGTFDSSAHGRRAVGAGQAGDGGGRPSDGRAIALRRERGRVCVSTISTW